MNRRRGFHFPHQKERSVPQMPRGRIELKLDNGVYGILLSFTTEESKSCFLEKVEEEEEEKEKMNKRLLHFLFIKTYYLI